MSETALTEVKTCLAIDIGATKFALAVIDAEGAIRGRQQENVVGAQQPFRILQRLIAQTDISSCQWIGVAAAGPLDETRDTLSPLNLPQWRAFPLRQSLEDHVGLPVRLVGDVHALALAERRFGAARGQNSFMSMVVSTGIGGAFVLGGSLLRGRTGNSGHVGHMTVVPGGRPCGCGSRGCLEAEASGQAIEEIAGVPARDAPGELRERAAMLVGRVIGNLATVLDFTQCYVGGSVALGYGSQFFEDATREAQRVAQLAYAKNITVRPSALGADGSLLGASLIWGLE